jgi:hypothetical protein
MAKDQGILKNFVGPKFAPVAVYLSSTELTGNHDYVLCLDMNKSIQNYAYVYINNPCINKGNYANVRAVKSF